MATGFPRGDRYSRGAIAFHWAIAALVPLHIAAALRHHFLLRDGVRARMLPRADRRG